MIDKEQQPLSPIIYRPSSIVRTAKPTMDNTTANTERVIGPGLGQHPSLRSGQALAALVGYALLSLVVTWPLALHFTTQEMGEDYFDRVQNTWNLWWVKVALLDRHASPFVTDLLFYPQGTDLYYHTLNLPSTLITLGPLLAFGPAAAYNTSVLVA